MRDGAVATLRVPVPSAESPGDEDSAANSGFSRRNALEKGADRVLLESPLRPGDQGETLTVMLPVYAPAAASWNWAWVSCAVAVRVLSWPLPIPVPAPVLVEETVGVIVGVPEHAEHVTVAVAGTVNEGEVPFEQRYVIAALPDAVVDELGSMLLPLPVLVMFTTGDDVKNLQTPTTVALTVTLTLSLAWAGPAPHATQAAAMTSERLM